MSITTNLVMYDNLKTVLDHKMNQLLPNPDPASPVAATVGTRTYTYVCAMPAPMFHKLFNQQDLPNGFTIEFKFGDSVAIVTYDATTDIPRYPDCEVPK